MNRRVSNIIWGLLFIGFGITLAGNILDLWDVRFFFKGWWTLFIIVPCVISIIDHGFNSSNLFGLVIGILLLLSAQNIFPGRYISRLIFPVILIIIGCNILFKKNKKVKWDVEIDKEKDNSFENNGDIINITSIFWGNEKKVYGEIVNGADCVSIFGGIDLDLRDAIIEKDIVIDSVNIFGGTDIYVPRNVNVKINSTSFFGGISDKSNNPFVQGNPTIYIDGTCFFGGVDIK